MKTTFNLIATAAAGLEAVVGREVRDLGYDCQVENGRVCFQGDVKAIIQKLHNCMILRNQNFLRFVCQILLFQDDSSVSRYQS